MKDSPSHLRKLSGLVSIVAALLVFLIGDSAQAATLTINLGGVFSGAVGVRPVGQVCSSPGPCTFTIAAGTTISITANTPSSAGVISGGTGDASACATSTCEFTLNTDSSITVNFNPGVHPAVSVTMAGDGRGESRFDSNRCQNFELGYLACAPTYYASGSKVTLEGLSLPLNLFTGFSAGTGSAAGCGTTPCVFTVTANSSAVANFSALGSLSVSPSSTTLGPGQTSAFFSATGFFTGGGSRILQAGSGGWRQQRNLSAARFSTVGAVVNQRLYLAGGHVPSGPSSRLESYDPATDSFALLASIPTPRSEFAGAVLGGSIYAVGGHTSGGGPVAAVEAYNPATNAWAARASLPAARARLAAGVINGVLYAVGGDQNGGGQNTLPPLASLDAYDPGANTWTSLAPMPTARTMLVAVALDGKLYALGGGNGAGSSSAAVEVYDPSTNAWSSKTPLPVPKAFLGAVVIDGLIYAPTLTTVEAYNPATDTWTSLDGMRISRSEIAVGALDGRLWVAGGLTDGTNTSQSTAFEAFRPPEATWWSSNRAVASIGQNGPAVANAAGTTTISARAGTVDCATTSQCGTLIVSSPPGNLGTPTVTSPASGQTLVVTGVGFAWTGVPGATGYDLRVSNSSNGAIRFSGTLSGGGSTSTLISLPSGSFRFSVRACSGGFAPSQCGAEGTVLFTVSPAGPTGAPTITFPTQGGSLTASTQTLSWTAVPPNPALSGLTYEVLLRDLTNATTALQITVPSPTLSTIFTMRSSSQYELKVRACQAGCGPYSAAVTFSVTLPAVPTTAPVISSCTVSGGNTLNCNWGAVMNADAYQVQMVQPPPSGPGGGALTGAAMQVSATSVTLPVPSGAATVFIAACNGDGCGPNASVGIVAAGPNPSQANLGTPMAGTVVSGPGVLFTWNRVPGDTGSNTWYRLFVQDLSRQSAALDVYALNNFYAAFFKAEGGRYDALVISNPGLPGQATGPAQGFNVSGLSATAPTLVSPPHNSSVTSGNIQLGWSPVPGATLYEYFVAVLGQGNATARGVTPGLLAQVPLTGAGAGTLYSGIVRACPANATCVSGSDAGWGPWSNAPGGPGVTNFTVIP